MSIEATRSVFFDDAEGYSEYLCARVGDTRLLVRTQDKHIGRAVFVKGGRGDIKVLRRCVLVVQGLLGEAQIAGRTLIDVGANIGTTTIPALCDLPFANGVALEPEAENFLTLKLNVLLNRMEGRATAIRAAASNSMGELDLMVDQTRSGKHWIAIDEGRIQSAKSTEARTKVPVVTLDSLAREAFDPDNVGLLWVDAENHEGHILEGASELLHRGVPVTFEWDREGLDERGDRSKIQEIVNAHYTHFVDMRASSHPHRPKYELRAADTLEDYAHLNANGEEHFTEILALRLQSKSIHREDLMSLLKRRVTVNPQGRPGVEALAEQEAVGPRRDASSVGMSDAEALHKRLAEVISRAEGAATSLARLENRIAELERSESSQARAKLDRVRRQAAGVTSRLEKLHERRDDIERRLGLRETEFL